jgi:hypothetical protein
MSMMPPRNPAPARDSRPVLSVGRRVFLNCPPGEHRRVTLTDDAGQTTRHTLADGVEVEILAWRPHAPGGARYRVQVMGPDRIEGWLGAADLRPALVPTPPSSPATATREEPAAAVRKSRDDGGRKFGSRAR